MHPSIFIVFAVVLFISWQIWIYRKSKRSIGEEISYSELETVLSDRIKDNKGLIYFFSPSCSKCKSQKPIIDEISKKNKNVLSVNVYENIKAAKIFHIVGTPSIIFFEGNKIKDHLVGLKDEEFLLDKLENL